MALSRSKTSAWALLASEFLLALHFPLVKPSE
jgi:hypothetical protein